MKNLTKKYHAGQFRKGEERLPYIVHQIAEDLHISVLKKMREVM